MVTLSIVFDLSEVNPAATKDAKGDQMSNGALFNNMTGNFIATYANQNRGLTYEEQRIYGKLMSTLKAAEKDKSAKTIGMEDAWHEFLKKVIKVKMMPGDIMTPYFNLIENPLPQAKLNK